jgi:phenylpropionate dioxygenase-like ring-hydroxylating dioxygenase large terminal subunit
MKITELAALKNEWVPVALADSSTPKLIRLFGSDYVLWRSDNGAVLFDPWCPHRGARLDSAAETGCTLKCPYHGWEFGPDGCATLIPQLEPGLPIPPKAKVRSYPVVERYGVLWACVGTPISDGPPIWQEAEEGGWRVQVDFFETWNVSAFRIIDNNLDQSHPAFVHQNTFGNPSRPLVPKYHLEMTPRGFKSRIPQYVEGAGPQLGIPDESVPFDRFQEAELLGPLHTRIRLVYPNGIPDYCFYGSATPIDDGVSNYLRISALAGDETAQPYGLFHAYSRRVVDEDRVVLELTDPNFPIDPTAEVHLRCDRNTLEYRRVLQRLAHPKPKTDARSSSIL